MNEKCHTERSEVSRLFNIRVSSSRQLLSGFRMTRLARLVEQLQNKFNLKNNILGGSKNVQIKSYDIRNCCDVNIFNWCKKSGKK